MQLVHGTIKKLIPPEDSQDEDGNNEDSNNTLTASGSSVGDANKGKKGNTPGLSQFMAVLTTMQSTVEKPQTMEESDSESSQDGCEEDFDTSVIEEYSVPLQLVSFFYKNYFPKFKFTMLVKFIWREKLIWSLFSSEMRVKKCTNQLLCRT